MAAAVAAMLKLSAVYGRSYSGLLIIAVALSSWYCGLGVGLAASAVATLVASFFFHPPPYAIQILNGADFWQLIVFGSAAIVVGVFSRQRRKSDLAAELFRHQAFHDPLTGLANRLLALERLDQAIRIARRYGHAVDIVMMDLDGFKSINDTLGHDAGDIALRRVGECVSDVLRDADTVARWGGDEFVMILSPGDVTNDISAVVKKIKEAIASLEPVKGSKLRVQASLGTARYPDDGETMEDLLLRADAAMYRTKRVRQPTSPEN